MVPFWLKIVLFREEKTVMIQGMVMERPRSYMKGLKSALSQRTTRSATH